MLSCLTKATLSAKNLLFPVQCPGCFTWDQTLCAPCSGIAGTKPKNFEIEDSLGVPDIPLLSLGAYEGTLRNLVLAAKHDPNHNLGPFLHQAGFTLGLAAGEKLKDATALAGRLKVASHLEVLWVVGAPPSHKRRRKRMEIVPGLRVGVMEGLVSAGWQQAREADMFTLKKGRRSQSDLSGDQRRIGRKGALSLRAMVPPGGGVVLVDDVVTTGATMREMSDMIHPAALLAVSLSAAV